ncbi:MAG: NAD(P)H-dependent oxidoreductase subunit E [Spirochaetota bacterium]
MSTAISSILKRYNGDETRLMDMLIDIQSELGYLSESTIDEISRVLSVPRVNIEQTVSFYHFFSKEPRGKYTVYLNNGVVSGLNGREEVHRAFEEAADCRFGSVSKDGVIGLFETACIGMSDQEPAAIINDEIFPRLTAARVRELVTGMFNGKPIADLKGSVYGDGRNADTRIRSLVHNNIRKKGDIVFSEHTPGEAIKKIVAMGSSEVINLVKASSVRGRGGAGFPTGMKWEVARKAAGDTKYIFCNADEGEPGTFKDRVILTEMPKLVFEGMAVAGYAVGATMGILYLRNEYRYLRAYLERTLEEMRTENLLGSFIAGKSGFNFDIRIQFGAGAYVCGEESALIESAEGKRGEPRDRPPFPVEKGYLDKPTVVNNVETLCSIVKVLIHGADWYNNIGTAESKGTKVISVSGDCEKPGIYEIAWGFSVNDVLSMVGATDVQAVQIGGPSGSCIAPNEFNRVLAYEDLATGGSLIIIGKKRDLLRDVVLNFSEFFREESCGSCVPCRVLTGMAKRLLVRIIEGAGTAADLETFTAWAAVMKKNRCGLGQTALNPIITTLRNFRPLYGSRIKESDERFVPGFDLAKETTDYEKAVTAP